jgi:opacity protein-like surface antigen
MFTTDKESIVKKNRALMTLAAVTLLASASSVVQAQLYLRADLGYSWSRNADIKDKNFPLDQGICGNAACTVPGKLKDVGDSAILGGGVGWRLNPNVRVDGTLAYRGWYDLDKNDAANTKYKADVKSWNLMLNGYYDFAAKGVSPYVGAGIGWARNKVDSIKATNPIAPGVTITAPGGTKSSFAWALMAGVGVPLNPTMTLDVGVRYTDLGKLETNSGGLTAAAGAVVVPAGTYSGAKGNLRAWEFTVGLRF